jgi:hypothetical protein
VEPFILRFHVLERLAPATCEEPRRSSRETAEQQHSGGEIARPGSTAEERAQPAGGALDESQHAAKDQDERSHATEHADRGVGERVLGGRDRAVGAHAEHGLQVLEDLARAAAGAPEVFAQRRTCATRATAA